MLLPFGENPDGRIVHISEVPSGLKCQCACPHCRAKLVARKGNIKQHHFAHHATTECRHAYESAIHKLAKEILYERKHIKLPEAKAEYENMSRIICREINFGLDEVRLEKPMFGIIPDVVAKRKGKELLIEIAVTHFCGPQKITKIRERSLATIEIDLSQLSREAAMSEIGEALLHSAPRSWIYNSRIEMGKEELKRLHQQKPERIQRTKEKGLEDKKLERARQTKEKQSASKISSLVSAALKAKASNSILTREHDNKWGRIFARLSGAKLSTYTSFATSGDWCFRLERKYWQSQILYLALDSSARSPWRGVLMKKIFATLGSSNFIHTGLCLDVDEQTEIAVQARVKDFRAPHKIIDDYLRYLEGKKIVSRNDRGLCLTNAIRARVQ